MTFKTSTFGESSAKVETPITPNIENIVVEAAVETQPEATIETVAKSETVVNNEGTLETAAPETTVTPEAEAIDDGNFEFKVPLFGEEKEKQEVAEKANSSLDDILKGTNRKDILKKLGVSDFAIELEEYIENGGDVHDLLQAKAFNWEKVPNADVVKDELKKNNPNLSAEKLQRLFEHKYKQGEYASDEDKEIGEIELESDAFRIRQQRIANQQAFKMPEPKAQNNNVSDVEAQNKAVLTLVNENEATKQLMQSKRVAIPLGKDGSFNFNINTPEVVVKAMTDGAFWKQITANKQGEPDIEKLIRISKYALDPDAHDKAIFNYGQSKGHSKVIDEGRNAQRPITKPNVPATETLKEAFAKRAKVSTYGGQ